jgi:hypothetical protein
MHSFESFNGRIFIWFSHHVIRFPPSGMGDLCQLWLSCFRSFGLLAPKDFGIFWH